MLSLEKDGVLIEGENNLPNHATEYYSDLFVPTPDFDVIIEDDILNGTPHCLRQKMRISADLSLSKRLGLLCSKWKRIKQQAQIISLLNSIKLVGTS